MCRESWVINVHLELRRRPAVRSRKAKRAASISVVKSVDVAVDHVKCAVGHRPGAGSRKAQEEAEGWNLSIATRTF